MSFDLCPLTLVLWQVEDDSEPEYHQLFEYVFVVSLKEDAKKKITTEMTYTFPPVSWWEGGKGGDGGRELGRGRKLGGGKG